MKINGKIFLLLFTLFYLSACSNKEENPLPPCLLTVDITVIDVDADTKKLVPVAAGGGEPYDYLWNGTYMGDTLTVNRSGGPWGPGKHVVRAMNSLGGCQAYDSVNVDFACGTDTIVTDTEGNVYQVISIGNQCWIKSNLKVSAGFPEVADSLQWLSAIYSAWCYNINPNVNAAACGKLYNWYAVQSGSLCPTGWHIPTKAEFDVMINFYGGVSQAGISIQNPTKFGASLCGSRISFNAAFGHDYTQFWTSTLNDSISAWSYDIYKGSGLVSVAALNMKSGLSCRCIKD